MATAEWAGRKHEYVEVEKETIGLEKREKRDTWGGKFLRLTQGKGHTMDERMPNIFVFRRKPDIEKVLLPPTIKYTPHPETAEKNQ